MHDVSVLLHETVLKRFDRNAHLSVAVGCYVYQSQQRLEDHQLLFGLLEVEHQDVADRLQLFIFQHAGVDLFAEDGEVLACLHLLYFVGL